MEDLELEVSELEECIADLLAQLAARVPDDAAAERIRELEAQVAALTAAKAEAPQRPLSRSATGATTCGSS